MAAIIDFGSREEESLHRIARRLGASPAQHHRPRLISYEDTAQITIMHVVYSVRRWFFWRRRVAISVVGRGSYWCYIDKIGADGVAYWFERNRVPVELSALLVDLWLARDERVESR